MNFTLDKNIKRRRSFRSLPDPNFIYLEINFALLFRPFQSYSSNGQSELPLVVKLKLNAEMKIAKTTGFPFNLNFSPANEIKKYLNGL